MKKSVIVLCLLLLPVLLFASGKSEGEKTTGKATSEQAAKAVYGAEGLIQTFEGGKRGPLPIKFFQSPILDERVAKGELPPVEERLPDEPMVVEPIEGIGKYGGILRVPGLGPGTAGEICGFQETHPFHLNKTSSEVLPEFAKGLEYTQNFKVLTIFLREGLKWSDGAPFTTEDFIFWWEDVMMNEEIRPGGPYTWWKVMGEFPTFTAVDDFTLRIDFPKPYKPMMGGLTSWMGQQMLLYEPKHYLTEWHIKYNPKAGDLAKEEGFDHWYEAFLEHHNVGWGQWEKRGKPVLKPWMQVDITQTARIYERNPYYFAVDTVGNQLPYIDGIHLITCGDEEMINMKTIAGDLDFASRMLEVGNYPLYKKNAEQGGYRVLDWKRGEASAMSFAFNLNHDDAQLNRIFSDVRFRRAMSLAINRDEINETVFYGLATPTQNTVDPACSFFKQEWAEKDAEYAPKKANALLDEMGLKWDSDKKFRLRADGKPITFNIELIQGVSPDMEKITELVKEYWAATGVKVTFTTVERALHGTRMNANDYDVSWWAVDGMEEYHVYIPGMPQIQPDRAAISWARDWAQWWHSGGEDGEEPPEKFRWLFETFDNWYTAESEDEYQSLAEQIFDFYADEMLVIGTVGYAPMPTVVNKNLMNVPEDAYYGENSFWGIVVLPMQFSYK